MPLNQSLSTLILLPVLLFGTLDRIQKALEKKEFEKVEELILKGYEKEPANPGIAYYHAKLLFISDYQKYNPDSARIIISGALGLWDNASDEIMEDVIKDGLSRDQLSDLSSQVQEYLYQKLLDSISLQNIQVYWNKYPETVSDEVLIFKRDSIIFKEVRALNRESSFTKYIDEYPNSSFVPEADSLRDNVRYNALLDQETLKNYYEYLEAYPDSRWRTNIESFILNVSTAAHDKKNYLDFISIAENHSLKRRAANLLYYQDPTVAMSYSPLADSIGSATALKSISLFPVMDRDQFGFYNPNLSLQVSYQYDNVEEQLKCTVTNDDWIFVKSKESGLVITKDNQVVLDQVEDYKNLSDGAALILNDGLWYLYHKSGFKILEEPIEDAQVLDHRWIKVKSSGKWGLYTFLGHTIAKTQYDDIYVEGSFWVFEKDDLMGVYTKELILKEVEDKGLSLEFKFDDIEFIDSTLLIGYRRGKECLMDNELNFMIPWGEYEIFPDPSGWYLKSKLGYRLYNSTDERVIDRLFPYLESNEGWLVLETTDDWMLIPRHDGLNPSTGYDSLKIISPHAVFTSKDNKSKLLFSSGKEMIVDDKEIQSFRNHPDYVLLSNDAGLEVIDLNGDTILEGDYEKVSFLNDTLLSTSSKGKQGIMRISGASILEPRYESIIEKDGLVSILDKGKIGCFDLHAGILIEPKYESRIEKIGTYYVVKEDGKYGLIDNDQEEILSFKWDRIQQWSDSSYLVKQGIYNDIVDAQEEEIHESLEQLQVLYNSNDHVIYKFVQQGRFGLISNQHGILLNPEFTDIFNIGSETTPLFFADQHLSKAGFHVVSYVDQTGMLIFSKAYRKSEFDKILCED